MSGLEQYGEVIALKGQLAVVRVRRHSACSQCGRCGLGITGGEPVDPEVEVKNPIGAQVGQVVRITMDTRQLLKASFVVYLLPILGLISGILLGETLGGRLGLGLELRGVDLTGVGLGLIFMFAVYYFVRRWDKKIAENARFRPVAVDVVETAE